MKCDCGNEKVTPVLSSDRLLIKCSECGHVWLDADRRLKPLEELFWECC